MKGLLLKAEWDPKPTYVLSDFERQTGKAVEGFNVWRHPSLEITEVADPKPGPGEALIRIRACGVCGSDIHFYETSEEDYILYPGLTKFPAILGHEFAGEIVEIGPGPEAEGFKVGDRVTVEEMVWCGHCRPCRDGYPNHCTNLEPGDQVVIRRADFRARLVRVGAATFYSHLRDKLNWGVSH